MPDYEATIVRLELGDSRNDYSIVVCADDLTHMLPILSTPCIHLHNLPLMWPKGADGKRIEWPIFRPTTIVLESILSSFDSFFKFVSFFKNRLPEEDAVEITAMLSGGLLKDTATLKIIQMLKMYKRLIRSFPKGLFIAEFAANTHTVLIRYLPPCGVEKEPSPGEDEETAPKQLKKKKRQKVDPEPPCTAKKPNFRFNTKITSQTFVRVSDEVSYLHFDIGSDSADRADLVYDYIIHRSTLINHLIEKHASFFGGTSRLLGTDQALSLNKLHEEEPPTFNSLPLPPRIVLEQVESKAPAMIVAPRADAPPECICVDLSAVNMGTAEEPEYYLDSMLVKHYFVPCD